MTEFSAFQIPYKKVFFHFKLVNLQAVFCMIHMYHHYELKYIVLWYDWVIKTCMTLILLLFLYVRICFEQRKEKIEQAKAAQEKKKADYKAGRAFGVSTDMPQVIHSVHIWKYFYNKIFIKDSIDINFNL